MAAPDVLRPRTLWRLGDELSEVERALDDMEMTADDRQAAIDAYLDGAEDLKAKVDGYCALVRHREATAKARKEEADRLLALAQADTNAARSLKERLQLFMTCHGLERLETPRFKVAVVRNGGVPPMELLVDPEALPPEYQRVTIAADTAAIRAELEAGHEPSLPWTTDDGEVECRPIARLGERGYSLRVR